MIPLSDFLESILGTEERKLGTHKNDPENGIKFSGADFADKTALAVFPFKAFRNRRKMSVVVIDSALIADKPDLREALRRSAARRVLLGRSTNGTYVVPPNDVLRSPDVGVMSTPGVRVFFPLGNRKLG